jgi:hypothetical protein
MRARRSQATIGALSLLVAACANDDAATDDGLTDAATADGAALRPPRDSPLVGLRTLTEPVSLVEGADATSMSIAASEVLFGWTPVVVVDAVADDGVADAAALGEELGVPTFVADGAGTLAAEIQRLGARVVLSIGELADVDEEAIDALDDVSIVDDVDDLPDIERATPTGSAVAVTIRGDTAAAAAAATARAAGLAVVELTGDPRHPGPLRDELIALAPTQVVGIATPGQLTDAAAAAGLVGTVVRGVELPGGGQVLFPRRRLVALYGHPGDPNLGVLGEQDAAATVERARQLAATYDGLDGTPAVPTLEIITTVASSEAGSDGDYSLASSLDHIRPFVDAAGAAGQYVILDLQPGFTDFLTQAKLYEELLRLPHVGLALDPEWRLAPGEMHMEDIGQVSAAEVNAVASWLAALTRDHALPQKLLLLHQFRTDMLPDRAAIRRHPELALVVQMDGNGSPALKLDTWSKLLAGGPAGLLFGWKNFYDEDSPMLTPAETIAVEPTPVLVSYQ